MSFLVFFSSQSLAAEFAAKVISIHDGDTFTIELSKEYALIGKSIPIRVFGIDAPELSGKNPCEKEKALKAKEALRELLTSKKKVTLKNVKRDKYFRLLADVYSDGKSVSDAMLKAKLAYSYTGKTKQKINWCILRE